MNDKDFSDLGREFGDKINKFVNSKDIRELQENIRMTVESAMQGVERSVKGAADYVNKNVEIRWYDTEQKKQQNPNVNNTRTNTGKQNTVSQDKRSSKEGYRQYYNPRSTANQRPAKRDNYRQLPVVKRPQGAVAGIFMIIAGVCGTLLSGITAMLGYSFAALLEDWIYVSGFTTGISGLLAALSVAVFAGGITLRKRAKRFRKYVKAFGQKDFYSIKGLSDIVGKPEKYVVKDLKKMIKRGWFKEGHLDEQDTCFMLTGEAYRMYLDAQAELVRKKEEEERLARERELLEQDPVRKQVKIATEEGKEYIRRIREVNDDIPGEDISQKLYRLEKVCTRIFEHIEKKPEKLPDIRKFMNYYLPTTLKLVETYHEFSIQPVQGENIKTARAEIEDTLDDINMAFEKMFDKMFEDDALDISTDISVLSAMLAQEGLLEDEFKV